MIVYPRKIKFIRIVFDQRGVVVVKRGRRGAQVMNCAVPSHTNDITVVCVNGEINQKGAHAHTKAHFFEPFHPHSCCGDGGMSLHL